jgi:hypothetical protein
MIALQSIITPDTRDILIETAHGVINQGIEHDQVELVEAGCDLLRALGGRIAPQTVAYLNDIDLGELADDLLVLGIATSSDILLKGAKHIHTKFLKEGNK